MLGKGLAAAALVPAQELLEHSPVGVASTAHTDVLPSDPGTLPDASLCREREGERERREREERGERERERGMRAGNIRPHPDTHTHTFAYMHTCLHVQTRAYTHLHIPTLSFSLSHPPSLFISLPTRTTSNSGQRTGVVLHVIWQ